MSEATDRRRDMHFAIRFLTRYEYDTDVVDNINALRVRPASNKRQMVDDFTVRLTPDVRQYRHEDYFGTEVVEFEISRPHREMVIDVRARVSTQAQDEPSGTTWRGLETPEYRERGGEFLFQTEDAPGNPLLEELATRVGTAANPLEAVMLVSELIPDRFEYRKEEETSDAESVEVDTHAWIEALLPDQDGEPSWVSVDPTNRGLATTSHVKIGHGRHYADIPPIKGVYRGQADAKLEASVTITRTEGADPAGAARST
jgi:transglutaminase-like putative cysteine protease